MTLNDRTAESYLPTYRCSLQNVYLSGNNASWIFLHFCMFRTFWAHSLSTWVKGWLNSNPTGRALQREKSLLSPQSHIYIPGYLWNRDHFSFPQRGFVYNREQRSLSPHAERQKSEFASCGTKPHYTPKVYVVLNIELGMNTVILQVNKRSNRWCRDLMFGGGGGRERK